MRRLLTNCGKTFAGILLGSTMILGAGCATDDSLDVLQPRVPTTPDKIDDADEGGADFFIPEEDNTEFGLDFDRIAKDPGDHPRAFLPVGDDIYWVADIDGHIQAIFASQFDSSVPVVVATKVNVDDLAGNADGLWWIDGVSGLVMSKRNGDEFAAPVFDLPELPTTIDIQGDAAYIGGADGTIFAANLDTDAVAPITGGEGVPMDIKVMDNKVYWSSSTKLGDNLYMHNLDTGDTIELVSRFDLTAGFVVDGNLLAWADTSLRAVLGIDPDGGEPFLLSEGHFGISGIAMDRASIYVTSTAENSVRFVPRQGGTSRLEAINLDAPANPVLTNGRLVIETDKGAFVATP